MNYPPVLLKYISMRTADSKVDLDDDGVEAPSPPQEFRCPTLELMRDPVVASSGQTYDRESITRWFGSGKSTCPKTGQVPADSELVPNKALKNLIVWWCRENDITVRLADKKHIKIEEIDSRDRIRLVLLSCGHITDK